MKDYIGMEAVIEEVNNYVYSMKDIDWSWSAEWLEPIEESIETTIIGIGDTVYRSNGSGKIEKPVIEISGKIDLNSLGEWSDTWQPTMKLRYKLHNNVSHLDGSISGIYYLEQLWINKSGKEDWRSIEYVD